MSICSTDEKVVVIDVVGLSAYLVEHLPFLKEWAKGKNIQPVAPMLPAVTTAVQSTYLTGLWPTGHGIVGNGWYDRADCEVKFWKQSDKLVTAMKIWERLKRINPALHVPGYFGGIICTQRPIIQ